MTPIPYSTVATAPSPASSGTSLTVRAGSGGRFPAVPFYATVWATGAVPLGSNSERVQVTVVAGDVLTVVRSGSPRSIVVGDQVAAESVVGHLYDAHPPALGSITEPFIAPDAIFPLSNAGLGFDASGIAKGGMLSGTGAGTMGITAVAADGTVWTADAASAGGAKWGAASSVTGSGTAGKITKWSSASALTDSIVSESGTTLTVAGLLTATGFGTHLFSGSGAGNNIVGVHNSSAANSASSRVWVGNDVVSDNAAFGTTSSTFVPVYGWERAAGSYLIAYGTGGLSIAAYSTLGSGDIRYYAGGSLERGRMHSSGGMSWGDAVDPGNTNFRVLGSIAALGGLTTATQDLITQLGTITSGIWNAGSITSSGPISGTKGRFTGDLSGGTDALTIIVPANGVTQRANLVIQNSHAAGVAVNAYLVIDGDTDNAGAGYLRAFSSLYTTSGPDIANAFQVKSIGTEGLVLAATDANGSIRLFTGGTAKRGTMYASGGFSWGVDSDPGAANVKFGGTLAVTGAATFSSTVAATAFSGSGASLTGVATDAAIGARIALGM